MARNCCRYFTVSLVPAAALILAVVFGCGIILLPVLYAEYVRNYVYGVVIDAGSSHTNMYIYRWQVPSLAFTQSSTGKVEQVFSCCNQTSVNSRVSDPQKVSDAFITCLNKSYNPPYSSEPYVPEVQRINTQLFLGATAGMRLVREQNATLSREVMDNIAMALKNSNISQYHYNSSKILSGGEEALSGWITTNYLHQNHSKFSPGETIGALDMGGASTQISFENNGSSSPYHVQERVFGSVFNLYSRSLLCFGENEAHSRYLAYLISKSSGSSEVYDPCLPNGSKVTYSSSRIYTACVNSNTASRVFGYSIPPPLSLSSAQSYTFVGKGNSNQCREDINSTMTNFCIVGNCNGSSYTPPPVAGHFKGFSGYYHTASFFNSSNSTFTTSTGWNTFTNNVSTFCNYTIGQIRDTPLKNDPYINMRCFAGQFILLLLENGYGFKQGQGQWSVEFRKEKGGSSLGWALGYMLDKSSTIPQSPFYEAHPYTVVDLVVGVVILLILCAIFVTFFFLTCYACRKALSSRTGYQNI